MDDLCTAVGGFDWPIEDLFLLYSRIEAHIPKSDKTKFTLSEVKLPWQKIAFGTHTAEECFNAWKMARSRVRSFRLLTEMVIDARNLTQRVLSDNCPTDSYDPKPKKPPNIFAIFAKEYRALHPEVPHNEQFKQASEEYHKLSDSQKEKYKKKIEEDHVEYEEKMSEYRKKYPELQQIRGRAKGGQKSALTPFNVFFDEQEKDKDNYNMTALRKQYKEVWNNMSDVEKLVWMEKAHEIEQKLEKNILMAQNSKFTKKGNVLTKKEILIRNKALGIPSKPPRSSYQVFRTKVSKLKDPSMPTNLTERSKWFSEKWKLVSSKEKEEYDLQLAEMKEEYKKRYASYLKSLNHQDIEETSELKTVCLAEPKKNKKKKPVMVDEVDEVGNAMILDNEEETKKKKKKKQDLEKQQMHAEEQVESHEERKEKKKKKKSKVEPESVEEQQGLDGAAVVEDEQMYAEENIQVPEKKKKKKKKSKSKPDLVEEQRGYGGIAVEEEIIDPEYRKKKKKHKRDRKKSESNLDHEEVQTEEQEVITLNDDHVNIKKRKRKHSIHDEGVKFESGVVAVPENEPDQQMITKKRKKKKMHHSE